jgi:hypothetical protein
MVLLVAGEDEVSTKGCIRGTERCRGRVPRGAAIGRRHTMRADLAGWRSRAGEIRDDKEQVIAVGFSLEERGAVVWRT